MASLNDKIIRLKAKEFNKIRTKTLPQGIRCFLLSKASRTGNYTVELEVTNWLHSFNNYREQTNVQVATLDSSFQTAILRSSDLAIGVTECEVFEIVNRDVIPPNGDRPWWQIFCTRVGESFTPTP